MIILSLFDGMSCGQIALNRCGIKYDKYYAAEIDKHAIKVTQANYPDTIQLGDVTKWKEWDIDWSKVDLLLAGSPCQGFSFAGKQLAFDDPRSALFFVFVDIWKHIQKHNPDAKYLLENVRMKKEHEAVINEIMAIEPLVINSALLSAQNRVRLYWTNIANEKYGLFGHLRIAIPQPKDKGILLKDVLETEVDEKYYLSDKMLNYFKNRAANFINGKVNIREEEGKSTTLTASMSSCDISDNFIKVDTNLKKSKTQDKANCFTAGGNSGGLHSDMTLIAASRGRNPENPKSRKAGLPTKQMLETRNDQKTNCLTSVQKDNLVVSNRIRRLTALECERLQTVPDNYTNHVSDTQRYRMLGNGWTVDVICHILNHIK